MSDEGRLVAGRYRIVGRVGTGAMGAVWQAHDEVLHRTVAIKQLLLQPGLESNEAEDARQRTMREGRIAARLHHPNAISVFDVVTDDNGQPCLIMEYLKSKSLATLLQERKTLPPLDVARIGAQIAAALKEAHAVGIVHRDIKPGNILLAGNGLVKITDFGISRAKDDVTVTKTGMIAGTPAYLAPEVAIGGDPGPESDIFSLGSTLYAACEGQPPFGLSENTLSLLHAVAAGQINPPRQSGPLASVLAVLLHPDVSHRPTAEECEDLLAAVGRGETPLGGATQETRVNRGAMGAGALGAGAAGAALGAAGARGADMPAGHYSGTLSDQAHEGTSYYDEVDDPYATRAVPAGAYPEDDYDDYQHDDYRHDNYPRDGNPDATRAVPVAGPYGDGAYPDDDGYDSAPAEAEEKRGAWKKPALIAGIVLLALGGFGYWIFGPSTKEDSQDPAPAQPPVTTSSSVSEAPPPSTTVEEETEEPVTTERSTPSKTPSKTVEPSSSRQPPPEPEEPEPSDPPSSSPEPTTTTTKSQTTTTTTSSTELTP